MTIGRARAAGIALEVVRAYAWVRVRHWPRARKDLPGTVSALRAAARSRAPGAAPTAAAALAQGRRLGYAVGRIVSLMPTESRCLMRALVLTAALERRAISSAIVIGVRPGSRLAAHAWVELEGEALLPPHRSTMQRLVEL